VAAGAATARTALHELTILGSHGGALSLVDVPEKTPLLGNSRRSPLAAGRTPSRLAAVRSSARHRAARSRSRPRTGAVAQISQTDDWIARTVDRAQRSSIDPDGPEVTTPASSYKRSGIGAQPS
jgi:hypothetical protein